jgi:methionine salvage enolase-phosphatase E1
MGKVHQNQKKIAHSKTETNALSIRKINTINRKQTPYKAVLKPIWTYGIQTWSTASNSYIEILQRFQSKTPRSVLNAPWYINNHRVHEDLQMDTMLSEIKKWNTKYLAKLHID